MLAGGRLAHPRPLSQVTDGQFATFAYRGNIASFNPSKHVLSIMFHRGAEIPGDHPRLEGDGRLVRTMRFADAEDSRPAEPTWRPPSAPGASGKGPRQRGTSRSRARRRVAAASAVPVVLEVEAAAVEQSWKSCVRPAIQPELKWRTSSWA